MCLCLGLTIKKRVRCLLLLGLALTSGYTDPRAFSPMIPENAKSPAAMAGLTARRARQIQWLPDLGSNQGPTD